MIRSFVFSMKKVFLLLFASLCFGFITVVLYTTLAHAGNAGGLPACQASLNTCNTNLNMCTSANNTCSSNLSTCNGSLSSCNSNLDTCNSNEQSCTSNLNTCTSNDNTCNSNLNTCTTNLNTCQAATCGNGIAEFGEACDGNDLHGQTCATQTNSAKPYGTLACNSTCKGFDTSGCKARFVDNSDGTITDNQTGLIWEKKDNTCPGIHCVNDTYTWSSSGSAPDGTAFTSFLANLNGGATGVGNCTSVDGSTVSGGFAGHCDWRLPEINELQTIIDTSASGCGEGNPCIDPIFGPTAANDYWSATTWPFFGGIASWYGGFDPGFVFRADKRSGFFVRAVRTGP